MWLKHSKLDAQGFCCCKVVLMAHFLCCVLCIVKSLYEKLKMVVSSWTLFCSCFSSIGGSALLQRSIATEVARRLQSPWTPHYCKNNGICWRGKPATWHREVSFIRTCACLSPVCLYGHVTHATRCYTLHSWISVISKDVNMSGWKLHISKITK